MAGRKVGERSFMKLFAFLATMILVAPTASALDERPDGLADDSTAIRIATWNIRWFPKGCPNPAECPGRQTDIDLLAATIYDLRLDLVAVQEILNDEPSRAAMHHFIRQLDSLSGGTWMVDLQDCGPPEAQRVGFLWNASVVQLSGFADVGQLNGEWEKSGEACEANLRPGRYAYVQSVAGGVDFHVYTVHFDSGRKDRDYQNRRDAARRIPTLLSTLHPDDTDVIVLGDFNTMGRSEPSEITGEAEYSIFDEDITQAYVRPPITPFCTEYYRGRGGVLDHVIVSAGMQEAAREATVGGYCATAQCADLDQDDMPVEYQSVSDHCPVILEIVDADLD